MKRYINNQKILKIGLGVLGLGILGQAFYIFKLNDEKDDKTYEVNLVKINNQKDSVDYLKMKNDLLALESTVHDLNNFFITKNIPNEKIAKLDKDSLSNTIYLAKQSNRFSQYLIELEKKLQQVPLGIPSDGYISSQFGKRKNPIPTKREVVMASVGSTTKTITKTEVITPEPRIVQVRDSTGKLIQEVKIQPKPKTVTTTETVQVAKNGQPGVKMANQSPAEPDQIQFHKGLDIAVAYGSDVRCTAKGKVIFSGVKGGYGNCVIVSHGNGLATLYAHLSQLLVKTNEEVDVNQVIAKSGNSGRSTGPHLHYEVHKNNQPVNPKLFINL